MGPDEPIAIIPLWHIQCPKNVSISKGGWAGSLKGGLECWSPCLCSSNCSCWTPNFTMWRLHTHQELWIVLNTHTHMQTKRPWTTNFSHLKIKYFKKSWKISLLILHRKQISTSLNFETLHRKTYPSTPPWEWIWSRRIVIMGIAESPASLLPHTLAPKFVSRWNVKLFFPPLPTNTSSYSYLLHHPHHNIIIVKTSHRETKGITGPRVEYSWRINYLIEMQKNLQQANLKFCQKILQISDKPWKAVSKLLLKLASCYQAVVKLSAVTNLSSPLFNVNISKSDNINKFWVGIVNNQSHINQVSEASVI